MVNGESPTGSRERDGYHLFPRDQTIFAAGPFAQLGVALYLLAIHLPILLLKERLSTPWDGGMKQEVLQLIWIFPDGEIGQIVWIVLARDVFWAFEGKDDLCTIISNRKEREEKREEKEKETNRPWERSKGQQRERSIAGRT